MKFRAIKHDGTEEILEAENPTALLKLLKKNLKLYKTILIVSDIVNAIGEFVTLGRLILPKLRK